MRIFVFSPERSLTPKARGDWEGIGYFRLRERINGIVGKRDRRIAKNDLRNGIATHCALYREFRRGLSVFW